MHAAYARARVFGVLAALIAALSVTVFPQNSGLGARDSGLGGRAPESVAAGGEATLRIIVLETADEARRVREELERGGNSIALATSRSVDPSAASGGMLGRVALSSLRPELGKEVAGLQIGRAHV